MSGSAHKALGVPVRFSENNQQGGKNIVSVSGRVDYPNAVQLQEFLLEKIGAEENHFILDLSEVDFLSSAGLRAILVILKACRKYGGDLSIAGAQPAVEKVIQISGFPTFLKIYPTVNDAIAADSI